MVMHAWVPDLRSPEPGYREIAGALAQAIQRGELRAGDRLPTHRELATRLGVALATVSRAYAEAARHGLIAAEVGRGTFVREPYYRAPTPSEERLGGAIDLGLL